MTSIAELEHRLQLAQEAEEVAASTLQYQQDRVRIALEALTQARIERGDA